MHVNEALEVNYSIDRSTIIWLIIVDAFNQVYLISTMRKKLILKMKSNDTTSTSSFKRRYDTDVHYGYVYSPKNEMNST
jgi:hypothetical protein